MHKMAAFNKKNYLLVSALSTSLSILLLLIKKETLAQVFSCEFCQISKNTFIQNTPGRLLLYYAKEED